MRQPIFLVDAFSHGSFTGNPAGVCPLTEQREEEWMQAVAMEMNQAETAFFWPEGDGFRLRWFTPTVEVDLCGHATLASAHVIFEASPLREWIVSRGGAGGGAMSSGPPLPSGGEGDGGEGPTIEVLSPHGRPREVRFLTRSGVLVCKKVGDKIELDFPSEDPTEKETPGIAAVLGAHPVWQGANRMDFFFELESEEAVRSLQPDLAAVERLGMRGVIVTAEVGAGAGVDFVSRFFAPQSGVPEDQVTGSAHCALGPYWAKRLNKESVTGYQASKRGGYVEVEPRGDRVSILGTARTSLAGELTD